MKKYINHRNSMPASWRRGRNPPCAKMEGYICPVTMTTPSRAKVSSSRHFFGPILRRLHLGGSFSAIAATLPTFSSQNVTRTSQKPDQDGVNTHPVASLDGYG